MRILDEAGKAVVPAVQYLLPRDLPEEVELVKNNFTPFQYPIFLNRTGRFTIEIEATDKIAKKSKKVSLPLTVLDINNFTGK